VNVYPLRPLVVDEIDFGEPLNATEPPVPGDEDFNPAASDPEPLRIVAETWTTFHARVKNRERPADAIPGLVPGSGITMIHGQPRSLKTWISLELARAAATGDVAFGLERFALSAPLPTWYITEEDPELEVDLRAAAMLGCETLDTFHLSVHRELDLDRPDVQAWMIAYGRSHQIRVTFIDPIRASSGAVDQGPREIRPLAAFLRRYMRETGSVVVLNHHDTKPLPGKPDERAKPQRASGGGIFSIADAPIHVELVGPGQRTLISPSHYKFAEAPAPFIAWLETDDPKHPTQARLRGESTSAAEASQLAAHEKIIAFLREHPGTSGSKVAKGVHVNKEWTLDALEALEKQGRVTHAQKGQAQLWSLTNPETQP
jgi:hypothetical protein